MYIATVVILYYRRFERPLVCIAIWSFVKYSYLLLVYIQYIGIYVTARSGKMCGGNTLEEPRLPLGGVRAQKPRATTLLLIFHLLLRTQNVYLNYMFNSGCYNIRLNMRASREKKKPGKYHLECEKSRCIQRTIINDNRFAVKRTRPEEYFACHLPRARG